MIFRGSFYIYTVSVREERPLCRLRDHCLSFEPLLLSLLRLIAPSYILSFLISIPPLTVEHRVHYKSFQDFGFFLHIDFSGSVDSQKLTQPPSLWCPQHHRPLPTPLFHTLNAQKRLRISSQEHCLSLRRHPMRP